MHPKHRTAVLSLLGLAILFLVLAVPRPETSPVNARAEDADRSGNPALQATSVPPRRTPTATALLVFPVVTSSPSPDGSISHRVEPGQTLIGIAEAYGLQINDLLTLNQLQPDSVIYSGDTLLIVPAVTPTITPTVTETARPTRAPSATRRPPPATPTQTQVPTITPTATATPWFRTPRLDMDTRSMGLVLIVVCAIGLVAVGVTGFRSR